MTSGAALERWLTGHDLFALATAASNARAAAFGTRGFYGVWRRLDGAGAWSGSSDAPLGLVDEHDLPALGGWNAARAAGASALLTSIESSVPAEGVPRLLRLPFHFGEPSAERLRHVDAAVAAVRAGEVHAVLPTPDGELQSLDTVRLFAALRLELDRVGLPAHVAAETRRLGPRLAQMALGFGADELVAPVVPARALRLGANARNPELTRAEVAKLLRAAGLQPVERLPGGELREVAS